MEPVGPPCVCLWHILCGLPMSQGSHRRACPHCEHLYLLKRGPCAARVLATAAAEPGAGWLFSLSCATLSQTSGAFVIRLMGHFQVGRSPGEPQALSHFSGGAGARTFYVAGLGFRPWLWSRCRPCEGLGAGGALLQLGQECLTSSQLCHHTFRIIHSWWCGWCNRATLVKPTSPRPPGEMVLR